MSNALDKLLNTFFFIVSEATKSDLRKRLESKHRHSLHHHRRA